MDRRLVGQPTITDGDLIPFEPLTVVTLTLATEQIIDVVVRLRDGAGLRERRNDVQFDPESPDRKASSEQPTVREQWVVIGSALHQLSGDLCFTEVFDRLGSGAGGGRLVLVSRTMPPGSSTPTPLSPEGWPPGFDRPYPTQALLNSPETPAKYRSPASPSSSDTRTC